MISRNALRTAATVLALTVGLMPSLARAAGPALVGNDGSKPHPVQMWTSNGLGGAAFSMDFQADRSGFANSLWIFTSSGSVENVPIALGLYDSGGSQPLLGECLTYVTQNDWSRCNLTHQGIQADMNHPANIVVNAGHHYRLTARTTPSSPTIFTFADYGSASNGYGGCNYEMPGSWTTGAGCNPGLTGDFNLKDWEMFAYDQFVSNTPAPTGGNFTPYTVGAFLLGPKSGTSHVYVPNGQAIAVVAPASGSSTFQVNNLEAWINGGAFDTRAAGMDLAMYSHESLLSAGDQQQPASLALECNVFFGGIGFPGSGYYSCLDTDSEPNQNAINITPGIDVWIAARPQRDEASVPNPQLSLEAYPSSGSQTSSTIPSNTFIDGQVGDWPLSWPGTAGAQNWGPTGLSGNHV